MARFAFAAFTAFTALAALAPGAARAEPYLAVRSGSPCVACHVSPGGGGKRNDFGSLYAQTSLAASGSVPGDSPAVEAARFNGRLGDVIAIGADLRVNAGGSRLPGSPASFAFGPTRGQLYVEARPLGERLVMYLDERVSPGGASVREAYGLFWFAARSAYARAGRLYVPFGLRLEDDTAFIRQVSGVSFAASDDGIEGGVETGPWSASLTVANGAGGAAENNRRKLASASVAYVHSEGRFGLSASDNTDVGARRSMQSAFGGLRTGIVAWLASAVFIRDTVGAAAPIRQRVGFVEANVEAAKGHNVKLTYEYHDPDTRVREDQRVRYSLVWEVVPFPFMQLRVGLRQSDGIPQNPAHNASEAFVQAHAFF